MPQKPLATCLVLAVSLLTAVSCSSGGGSDTPTSPGKKSTDSTGKSASKAPDTKLQHLKGKGDIKNVIVKSSSGKVSLSAKAPGHEVMEQIFDPTAKTWSAPTSVFKDDTRFCTSIKAKSKGGNIAATVTCSISAQDTNGTQSSYVLGSTDGKTWKRADLDGAEKPFFSAAGNVVAWAAPTGFLLWNPKATTPTVFTTVKYPQSADAPAVGALQNNGVLLIIKATQGSKKTCTISFQTASAAAPTPRLLNATAPFPGHPKCMAVSAKFQGTSIIGNFTMTTTTKDAKGKKVTKTTTFAYEFIRSADGKWMIKAP